MRRLLPTLLAGMLLGALVPAAASADATITPTNSAPLLWSPADVSIQTDQKVTWDFSGTATPHNIVIMPEGAAFPATPSGTAAFTYLGGEPKTFSQSFASAGTFRYFCAFHYSGANPMRGTITVTGSTPPPPPPAPTGALPAEPVAVATDRAASFSAEIFTLTGSEDNFKRLTSTGGEQFDPAWSYDAANRRIAFTRLAGPDARIVVMDEDGADQVDVTAGAASFNLEP